MINKDLFLILKYFDLCAKKLQIIGQLSRSVFMGTYFRQDFHRHEPLVYACLFLFDF
jgi:hypothetical protein